MWLGLALSYFLLCRASKQFAYANGLVHPEFCLTRDCLPFFRGDVQVAIEDRAHTDSVKVLYVASKTDQNRESCTTTRVRGGRGESWQYTSRSFRSTSGAPRRTPAISRRRPRDETYGVWVESDNSDRSIRCAENDGNKRRQEPSSVCVALGADRGSYQARCAGNVIVENSVGRPVEVSGVYGLCERCGRRRTKSVRDPYKGRISRLR